MEQPVFKTLTQAEIEQNELDYANWMNAQGQSVKEEMDYFEGVDQSFYEESNDNLSCI
jgi:hypothetical protein